MQEALKTLIERRANVFAQAQEHLDNFEKNGADDSGEAQATWEALNTDLAKFDARIAEVREIIKGEEAAREAEELSQGLARGDSGKENTQGDMSEDERKLRAIASGEARSATFEFRDLTVGTATAGGNTVPTSFVNMLHEHMVEVSAIRQTRAEVLTTDSGEAIEVPKTTSHGAAALVAEGGSIPESDPAFGKVTLNAYKYGQLIQVSSELLSDSAVDLTGYIARAAGRNVGIDSGTDLVVGDGSSKPNGVATAAGTGVTAASATTFTGDELIDLYFSVIGPYRAQGEWMFSDAALAIARKLKDSNGQYLWQPALTASEPDRVLGKPYVSDHNMAAVATGNKTVLFGDFSTYMIRQVSGVRVERSDDYAFNTDLVTWRVLVRLDGDQIDTTGAIKALVQA